MPAGDAPDAVEAEVELIPQANEDAPCVAIHALAALVIVKQVEFIDRRSDGGDLFGAALDFTLVAAAQEAVRV